MKNLLKEYSCLQKQLSNVGFICLGSINEVFTRCGSRYCDCKKNKKMRHGPYYLWTRKENSKTKSKYLSKKQAIVCRKYLKNYENMGKIIEKMKSISEKMIENAK